MTRARNAAGVLGSVAVAVVPLSGGSASSAEETQAVVSNAPDPRLQAQLEFRKLMGLSTDPAHLESLQEAPTAESDRQLYGAALTDEERAQVEVQMAAQAALAAFKEEIRLGVGESFAGLWIDQTEGGVVHVAVAEDRPDVERISGAFYAVMPEWVELEVETAAAPLSALEALEEAVAGSRQRMKEEGFRLVKVGIDVRANRVDVGVHEDDFTSAAPELLRDLAGERTPPGIWDRVSVRAKEPPEIASRSTPPLVAGSRLVIDRMGTNENFACTSGPYVMHGGNLGILTAGHCESVASSKQNRPWHLGSINGPLAAQGVHNALSEGTRADVAVGHIVNSSIKGPNCVYKSSSSCQPLAGAKSNPLAAGSTVFASGQATNQVVSGEVTHASANRTVNGVSVINQQVASFSSTQGDSGGPVFTAVSGNAYYVGSNVGGGWYSPWSGIQAELGVTM